MKTEQYLEMVQGWVDPYPAPVVEKIENLYVVRDDLLEAGSKMRFIDCLIRNDDGEEWVFGGANKVGWGPISLTAVCNRYGKKATFFMAKRKEPTWHQQKVLELGGTIHWVENGMLNVTKSRARKYQEEKPDTRRVLPLGLEHPTVIASIVKVAQSLNVQPSEIWTVASSGTLNRGLQLAFPDVDCYAIQVGHKMTDYEKGRAKVLISPYKYDRAVKPEDAPPYPSEPFYDAKVWSFVRDMAKKDALVWNVA
jgi:hypothetical protein